MSAINVCWRECSNMPVLAIDFRIFGFDNLVDYRVLCVKSGIFSSRAAFSNFSACDPQQEPQVHREPLY